MSGSIVGVGEDNAVADHILSFPDIVQGVMSQTSVLCFRDIARLGKTCKTCRDIYYQEYKMKGITPFGQCVRESVGALKGEEKKQALQILDKLKICSYLMEGLMSIEKSSTAGREFDFPSFLKGGIEKGVNMLTYRAKNVIASSSILRRSILMVKATIEPISYLFLRHRQIMDAGMNIVTALVSVLASTNIVYHGVSMLLGTPELRENMMPLEALPSLILLLMMPLTLVVIWFAIELGYSILIPKLIEQASVSDRVQTNNDTLLDDMKSHTLSTLQALITTRRKDDLIDLIFIKH